MWDLLRWDLRWDLLWGGPPPVNLDPLLDELKTETPNLEITNRGLNNHAAPPLAAPISSLPSPACHLQRATALLSFYM